MRKTYVYKLVDGDALMVGPSFKQCVSLTVEAGNVKGEITFNIRTRIPLDWQYCRNTEGLPVADEPLIYVTKDEARIPKCDPVLGMRFLPPLNEAQAQLSELPLVREQCEILARLLLGEAKVEFTVACPQDWKVATGKGRRVADDSLPKASESTMPVGVTVPQQ